MARHHHPVWHAIRAVWRAIRGVWRTIIPGGPVCHLPAHFPLPPSGHLAFSSALPSCPPPPSGHLAHDAVLPSWGEGKITSWNHEQGGH
eukprot:gene16408-biopygen17252